MADVVATDTREEIKTYVADKKIDALLRDFTEKILAARPADPEKFLRDHLNESIATREGALKIQKVRRGQNARKAVITKKQLTRAKTKFEKFDVDGSGTIDAREMEELAIWVFESFHPGGQPMSAAGTEVLRKKLMKRLDKDANARLDFEEFAEWFTTTCEDINRFRQSKAKKERAGAATKLQGKARQRNATKKVEGIKQDKAATKLQGKARQKNAKKRVQGIKQDKAATKMQSKQRQRQAKKRVEEIKEQM